MVREFVEQWDKNKDKLRDYFKTTPQTEYSSYKSILAQLLRLAVTHNKAGEEWDLDAIMESKRHCYHGNFVFGFNSAWDRASEFTVTYVGYGSCNGCDTLQRIQALSDKEDLPNEEQVNGYITLALHMVQKMRTPFDLSHKKEKENNFYNLYDSLITGPGAIAVPEGKKYVEVKGGWICVDENEE